MKRTFDPPIACSSQFSVPPVTECRNAYSMGFYHEPGGVVFWFSH